MTAALSWPLQKAVFAALSADAALTAKLGPDRLFDEPPHGAAADASRAPYIALGEESVEPWFDKSDRGAVHDFALSIVARRRGYSDAKQIAGLVCDALDAADLALDRGRVVRLQFLSAEFVRDGQGTRRRAELRFRAVLEDV